MKALITGATGFIGSHLARELSKKGFEVSCLIRKTSNLKWLEGLDIKLVQGDCSDRNSLNGCVRGQDYIFHLAGMTKANYRKDFYSVNAKGTENIIKSVAENNPGVKKFLYLSTLSAFGPKLNNSLPEESQKPHPVSDYGRSKLEGESAVLNYGDKVPVSILRPPVVYGPRDTEFFLFFKFIKKGILPNMDDGYTSLIYIDDLINVIMLTAEKEIAAGKIYFVSDDTVYSNKKIIDEIASALGVNVSMIRLPRAVLLTIGFFSEGISKIIGKSSMINRDKIKEIMHKEWTCDITKAKNELGFQPRVKIKEGIKWTADWYRIHKWL